MERIKIYKFYRTELILNKTNCEHFVCIGFQNETPGKLKEIIYMIMLDTSYNHIYLTSERQIQFCFKFKGSNFGNNMLKKSHKIFEVVAITFCITYVKETTS